MENKKEKAQKEKQEFQARIAELEAIINKPEITPEQRMKGFIEGCTVCFLDKYPNETFFFKGKKYMFSLDFKNSKIWVSYQQIWSVFQSEYGLEYQQIQALAQNQIEEAFKCKGLTVFLTISVRNNMIEEAFKCKGLTVRKAYTTDHLSIEEAFNCKGLVTNNLKRNNMENETKKEKMYLMSENQIEDHVKLAILSASYCDPWPDLTPYDFTQEEELKQAYEGQSVLRTKLDKAKDLLNGFICTPNVHEEADMIERASEFINTEDELNLDLDWGNWFFNDRIIGTHCEKCRQPMCICQKNQKKKKNK